MEGIFVKDNLAFLMDKFADRLIEAIQEKNREQPDWAKDFQAEPFTPMVKTKASLRGSLS